MIVPQGKVLHVPAIGSTQDELARWVRSGNRSIIGIRADYQTSGRGRFGRSWISPAGEALALSLALYPYANWRQPQLLGMALALAAAHALDLLLQWPNDLVLETPNGVRKAGGILAEMIPSGEERVPVIGIGINLTVRRFPAELPFATSLALAGRDAPTPEQAQELILSALSEVPEPTAWSNLSALWLARDRTPGKRYLHQEIPREAIGIDDEGRLLLSTPDGVTAVPSAEAWYGNASGDPSP
jgi:BirA family biotin operon repressor/biotin-[acetyl-CoA-carboxylase] ligase